MRIRALSRMWKSSRHQTKVDFEGELFSCSVDWLIDSRGSTDSSRLIDWFARIDWFISVDWLIRVDRLIHLGWLIDSRGSTDSSRLIDWFARIDWFISVDWLIRADRLIHLGRLIDWMVKYTLFGRVSDPFLLKMKASLRYETELIGLEHPLLLLNMIREACPEGIEVNTLLHRLEDLIREKFIHLDESILVAERPVQQVRQHLDALFERYDTEASSGLFLVVDDALEQGRRTGSFVKDSDWLTDWLTAVLITPWVHCLIDWLIDWLID